MAFVAFYRRYRHLESRFVCYFKQNRRKHTNRFITQNAITDYFKVNRHCGRPEVLAVRRAVPFVWRLLPFQEGKKMKGMKIMEIWG